MDKVVKWGIVGPGVIAHQFANDIAFTDNAEIVAVASNSGQKAKEFANKYSIPQHYSSYKELFSDARIDAIYISTTHNYHLQNAIDAIDAGKAVLCEKPLTDNLADTITLVEHARSKQVYLMEALWTYFLPSIHKAQKWINEGRIGEILNLKANFGYPKKYDPKSRLFNTDLSGGVLLDMGIYPVSMAWLFMKMDPAEFNVVMKRAPTGVDADVNMQLIYPDNRVANLHTSFNAKLNNHTYIIGTEGYIDIPDFWRSAECLLYKEEKLIEHFNDNRSGKGFEFEIAAASDDILNNQLESEIMTHEDSIKLQEHMAEIMKRFN